MDLTRATQNIEWSGTLDVRGEKIELAAVAARAIAAGAFGKLAWPNRAPVPPAPHNFTGYGRRAISTKRRFSVTTMMTAMACRGTAKRCLTILPMAAA